MITVLGIDPGQITGTFLLQVDKGTIINPRAHEYEFGDYCDYLDLLGYTVSITENFGKDFVVACEKFTITPKTPANEAYWSIENTGIAKRFTRLVGASWYDAKPSSTKPLITNDVLKCGKLYVPGKGHAMDAARICLHYLITQRKVLTELLRGPDE